MQYLFKTIHHQIYHHNLTALPPLPLSPFPSPLLSPSPSSSIPTGTHKMAFHTAFYWGKAHQILFPGWPGTSTGMYVVAVLLVFSLAILVECLAYCHIIKPGPNQVAACFFRTGMRAIRAGMAYMVILAVMSYNGGIFIAAVVGHTIGYLIFGSGLYLKSDGRLLSNFGIGHSKI
ncbi:copper transporter 6-like [Chenopodium quinoa]|nr:copper transporter 6-like [Chenopodium quinoa]